MEENLRLKEMNTKLAQSKKSTEAKYEVISRKFQQLMEINSNQAKSRGNFGDSFGKVKFGNMSNVASDQRGLSTATAFENDTAKEKLEFNQA